MPVQIRDGGEWKTVSHIYVRDQGNWKLVSDAWVRHGGEWKSFITIPVPQNLRGNVWLSAGGYTITFYWDAVSVATSYEYWFENRRVISTTRISATVFRRLRPRTWYTFRVRTVTSAGRGEYATIRINTGTR